ncbi:lytic transglycosylase domain-containing protein [Vibrio navarrensis]|nr:lytic transglycosylase domain-containing protein [Vibrio navarrensis]
MRIPLLITLALFPLVSNAFCFEEAAKRFDVNVDLLRAVCFTESSLRANVINSANSDGSSDYGLCQVNSWWLPKLAKYGITKESLLNDPCENTLVSAWILAGNFEVTNDGWKAVGAYNAGWLKTPEAELARTTYINLVKTNLERMTSEKSRHTNVGPAKRLRVQSELRE